MKVGLVCDSTCDLGPEYLAEHDVEMVPLKVLFGDESFLDWLDLPPTEFYRRLQAFDGLPKTSQPSPADFQAVYSSLAGRGCDEVVSIHLSEAVSGTIESAGIAAAEVSIPVRIVDTKVVTAASAQVVQAAIEARDAGADADGVEEAARYVVANQSFYFILETLDYLVKGGRAGKAQGLAASLLNIKPILTFNEDGIIEPFRKVKGMRKAMQEVASIVAERRESGPLRVRYMHAVRPEHVETLRGLVLGSGAAYQEDGVIEVGAVIGTYAGPGAVGVACYRPR